ncbi:hypothetical protein [Christiangramia sediminis]|uniref:Lipocalin-like domain-containing protein n=1 Tax=Christiangramia sediminis TaxID=2881336 RepID=A0A9X1RVN2_9FLAO|nr:hypothetical protein [Christiangramia sediminis]MCB7479827.1 hypothetical protein [Christiangramia sediminis]
MNYYKTILLLLFINTAYAQEYQSKNELKKQIIGTWHHEKSPEDKIVFFKDGSLKRFLGDNLRSTSRYKITKECDGEKLLQNNFFLKETSQNGTSSCAYIEGVNYNGNGILSLMTKSQGKIIVFKKDLTNNP